ncbi:MAG: hypothetical protein FD147_2659 [Chloroflexi bacterium]|nr:MAG: hypothetical protein FD147_2659 [Chloroflexota bacterium]
MKDFDQILDGCLAQISSGAASLDDCLARYPEHAAQLGQILLTAANLKRGRIVMPSTAFKARARTRLTVYMQAHPRRKSFAFPFLRLAFSMAALLLAFIVTGTALAQRALPGDALYNWKLTGEQVWRAVSPDPLAVDLVLSERRVDEMLAISSEADMFASALECYRETLTRLALQTDVDSQARILPVLTSQKEAFANIGISVPELDIYLDAMEKLAPTPTPLTLPTKNPPDISTLTPTLVPTFPIPTFPVPLLPFPPLP